MLYHPQMQCAVCNAPALYKCGTCGTPYCGRQHQILDWNNQHAQECILFRNLVPNDASALKKLDIDLFGDDDIEVTPRGVGAFINGTLVAYAIYDQGDLRAMGVHPAYRRRGIASRLLHMITNQADESGESVELRVKSDNRAAIRLYKTFGFKEIGTTQYGSLIMLRK